MSVRFVRERVAVAVGAGEAGAGGARAGGTRAAGGARGVSPAGAARTVRDASVDLVRAGCLVAVVLLHALMVGVSVADGAPVLENALDGWPGLAALTWVAQVMPLFFVLGGFSSFLHWSGMRAAGTTPAAYIAARMRRLLQPAVAAVAASAVLLSALTVCGVPQAVVATAGFRLSQPLWFLGVYVLCTAAVPFLVAAHERFPIVAVGGLAALAVGVDVVRASTGSTVVGFANLLFVWLLVQQLGFWLADGTVARLPRRALAAVAAGALVVLFVLAASGVYSFDLLANLNPPTFALVLLGIAQLCLFELARPALRGLARHRALGVAVAAINARAMTVYAWHMLALIGLAGLLLLSGMRLPRPLTPDWWATRPLWLAAVLVVVAAVVAVAGRREARAPRAPLPSRQRPPSPSSPPFFGVTGRFGPKSPGLDGVTAVGSAPGAGTGMDAVVRATRAWLSVGAGSGGVLVVLLAGSTVAGWVLGCACIAGALMLAARGPAVAARAGRILP